MGMAAIGWIVVLVLVSFGLSLFFTLGRGKNQGAKVGEGDALPSDASSAFPPKAAEIPHAQHYRSDKVGNDAAARPWDHEALPAHSGAETQPTRAGWEQTKVSTLSFRPDQLPDRLPAHFDLALLLERSKASFLRLHTAWEQADAAAVRELLVPTIWQQVEQAMQMKMLPDWGRQMGEIQHLAAHALHAREEDGAVRVVLEFTGSQWHEEDAQARPIHEVWDVAYHEQPMRWQIADLQHKLA